jgi:hypothetical protein
MAVRYLTARLAQQVSQQDSLQLSVNSNNLDMLR